MDQFFEDAQTLASRLSGSSLVKEGGMASVGVTFDPYEAKWFGKADWSNNVAFNTMGSETPTDAILELIDILQGEILELKNDKKEI
jgi:hypothetical protein